MKKKIVSILKNKKIMAFALAFAMVFAGCAVIISNVLNVVAAEVAPGMLDVKMQVQETSDGTYDMRLVSSVNALEYNNVGFEVSFDADNDKEFSEDETITWTTQTVLERIKAVSEDNGDYVTYKYSPKVIDTDSEYFVTGTLRGINPEKLDHNFYVRAFCTKTNNEVVYGTGRYFNIADATSDSVINFPVEVASKPNTDESGQITDAVTVTVYNLDKTTTVIENVVAYLENYDTNVAYADDTKTYAHINLEVPGAATSDNSTTKQKLPSACVVTIGEGENAKTAIYRNLESAYANKGADDSWYQAYVALGRNDFIIATDADLYGFSTVSQSTDDFSGKIVYQVADVTVNEGTAASTGFTAATGTTLKTWTAISPSSKPFAGTFDGQNHKISGLNIGVSGTTTHVGLFGQIKSGTVKNVKIENSYFTGKHQVGSIAGITDNGTFENIDVTAYVQASGGHVGGFFGQAWSTASKLTDCTFAGQVSSGTSVVGGFIGSTNIGATITGCTNGATVAAENGDQAGGFIGRGQDGAVVTISNSVNDGKVTATASNVGGFVGYHVKGSVEIRNSQNKKDIYGGTHTAGGFIGNANDSVTLIECTNTGNVTGNTGQQVGGLVGNISSSNTTPSLVVQKSTNTGTVKAGYSNAGGIVGQVYSATSVTIEDCKNTGDVSLAQNRSCAGIVGFLKATTSSITNCVNEGNTSGVMDRVAGIVGSVDNGGSTTTISGCKNSGNVTSTSAADSEGLGGIVARYYGAELHIINCENAGEVSLTGGSNAYVVGGILGKACCGGVNIEYCLNSGAVSSKTASHVGGIIGFIRDGNGSISNCFNSGRLCADSGPVASILGRNYNGTVTITNTYATTDSCAQQVYGDSYVSNGTTTYEVHGNDTNGIVSATTATNLSGILSETNAPNLDYDTYWVAVSGGTPQLKSFQTIAAVDMDWYEANKTADTLVVKTAEQLATVSDISSKDINFFAGKTVQLANDIVLNDGTASESAFVMKDGSTPHNWAPITSFSGTFDGKGHTISGLYINSVQKGIGLFAKTGTTAVIKNFKLTNGFVQSTYTADYEANVGSVAAYGNGTFEKIYSNIHILTSGGNAGGIAGVTPIKATFSECWFDGSLKATNTNYKPLGGIVGFTNMDSANGGTGIECEIRHCLNTAPITSNVTYIGGLVGYSRIPELTIKDSLNVGTLLPKDANKWCEGSIVGRVQNYTTITVQNTYAADNIAQGVYCDATTTEQGRAVIVSTSSSDLNGLAGYQKTTLDFDNYWVAIEGKTPELKAFASATPIAVSGVVKTITCDVSFINGNDDYEANDEFVIHTVEQFYEFAREGYANGRTFEGKTIKLATDLRVNTGSNSEWGNNAPAYTWTPSTFGTSFKGTFDGQGHTISGLYGVSTKNDDGTSGQGLFGACDGIVKDLSIVNCYFRGATEIGSVAGRASGTFTNIYADNIIATTKSDGSNMAGGLIGRSAGNITLTNCQSACDVSGQYIEVGGIIGTAGNGATQTAKLQYCLNEGNVYAKNGHVGGLVGFGVETTTLDLENCLNTGKVTGSGAMGALVGRVITAIDYENIYATTESYATCTIYKESNTLVNGSKVDGMVKEGQVSEANLTGAAAKTNAPNLDWDTYWTTTDGFPALQSFVEEEPLKVLMIGNSFCYYYADELYAMAAAAGVEMDVYNVYASGCPLSRHWEWYQNGTPYYTSGNTDPHIVLNNVDGRQTMRGLTLDECLGLEDWDVVSLMASSLTQYATMDDYVSAEFGEERLYLNSMYNMITKRFPNARMMWHHTWTYGILPEGRTDARFAADEATRLIGYKSQKDAVETYIKSDAYNFDVVPTGEAWEIFHGENTNIAYGKLCGSSTNGWSEDDEATKAAYGDFYHDGDLGGGQYLNACVWFEVLTGKSCIGNEFETSYTLNDYGLAEGTKAALQAAAHKAVEAAGYTVK